MDRCGFFYPQRCRESHVCVRVFTQNQFWVQNMQQGFWELLVFSLCCLSSSNGCWLYPNTALQSCLHVFLSFLLPGCIIVSIFTQKRYFRFKDGYSRRIWITICLLVVIYTVIVYFHVSDGTNPWMKKTPKFDGIFSTST